LEYLDLLDHIDGLFGVERADLSVGISDHTM